MGKFTEFAARLKVEMQKDGKPLNSAHRNLINLCDNYQSLVQVLMEVALAENLTTAQDLALNALVASGELDSKEEVKGDDAKLPDTAE